MQDVTFSEYTAAIVAFIAALTKRVDEGVRCDKTRGLSKKPLAEGYGIHGDSCSHIATACITTRSNSDSLNTRGLFNRLVSIKNYCADSTCVRVQ